MISSQDYNNRYKIICYNTGVGNLRLLNMQSVALENASG